MTFWIKVFWPGMESVVGVGMNCKSRVSDGSLVSQVDRGINSPARLITALEEVSAFGIRVVFRRGP